MFGILIKNKPCIISLKSIAQEPDIKNLKILQTTLNSIDCVY